MVKRTSEPGTRVPDRKAKSKFAFVDPETFAYFRRRWREIDSLYPALDPSPPDGMSLSEHWGNMAMLRKAARAELRAAVLIASSEGCSGEYPVVVS